MERVWLQCLATSVLVMLYIHRWYWPKRILCSWRVCKCSYTIWACFFQGYYDVLSLCQLVCQRKVDIDTTPVRVSFTRAHSPPPSNHMCTHTHACSDTRHCGPDVWQPLCAGALPPCKSLHQEISEWSVCTAGSCLYHETELNRHGESEYTLGHEACKQNYAPG